MVKSYAVEFYRTSTGFSAHCPDVAGCVAAGDTLEETRQLMAEGLRFHFEGMLIDGQAVPEPRAHVEMVDVDVPEHAPDPDPWKVERQPEAVAA